MIGEFPLGVKAVLKEGAYPLPPEETVNPEPYLYWIFGLTLFGGGGGTGPGTPRIFAGVFLDVPWSP